MNSEHTLKSERKIMSDKVTITMTVKQAATLRCVLAEGKSSHAKKLDKALEPKIKAEIEKAINLGIVGR